MKTVNLPRHLIDDCLTHLPGITDGVLLKQLAKSARQFCIDAEGYETDLAAINVVASQAAYVLAVPVAARIIRVQKVLLEDVEQDASLWTFSEPATLTFVNAPQAAVTGGLVVTVVLMPGMDAEEYPEGFVDLRAEAIRAHAIAMLKVIPKKEYSDPDTAGFWMAQYRNAMSIARYDKLGKRQPRGLERKQSPWIV